MKRKIFITIALLCCFAVSFAYFSNLNGGWTGNIKIPDGKNLYLTYNFKVKGNKLIGTAYLNNHTLTIHNGKIVGKSFKFQINLNGHVYQHTGKLHGDLCDLDIKWDKQTIHTTLYRID